MRILSLVVDAAPDVETGRRLYDLDGLSDEDCLNVMSHRRRQTHGGEDGPLPWHLRRVVGLTWAVLDGDGLAVESIPPERGRSEVSLLSGLFERLVSVERLVVCTQRRPGLDLLRGRALVRAVAAPAWPPCDCLDLSGPLGDVPCDEAAFAMGLPAIGAGPGPEREALCQLAIERRIALLEGRTTVAEHRRAIERIVERLRREEGSDG